MRTANRLRRRVAWAVLAGLGLVTPGCLRANVLDFARYDENTDTYHFLKVYTHVAGTDAELDWVARLWKNRGQVITIPELFPVLTGEPAFLHKGEGKTQQIAIGEPPQKEPPTLAAGISLAPIEIRPGKFFLSPEKTLCYYHEVRVPGKLIDELCTAASKNLRKRVIEAIDAELTRRREAGRTISWEHLRGSIRKLAQKGNDPGGEQTQPEPGEDQVIRAMDELSLGMIRKAAEDSTLGLTREGFQLQLRVPMTPADRREAIATVATAKKALLDSVTRGGNGNPSPVMQQWQAAVSAAVRAEEGPGGDLRLVLDVGKYVALATRDRRDAKPQQHAGHDYAAAVKKIRAEGIPIDEDLTLDAVVKSFTAGTPESPVRR